MLAGEEEERKAMAVSAAAVVVAEVAPAPGSIPSLAAALAAVPEHRCPRGFKAHQPPYPLVATLLLVVGVLGGRRGYQSIADWARGCAQEYPDVLDALGFEPERRRRHRNGASR